MAFGDRTGGRGGFGASFPTRRSVAPDSQVVNPLPFASRDQWQEDFDRRWGAASAPVPTYASNMYTPAPAVPFRQVDPNANLLGGDTALPPLPTRQTEPTSPIAVDTFNLVQTGFAPRDQAQLDALEAERARMPGMYDAFDRQTQAYSNMSGRGMLNGILTDAYSSPDYGRVSTAGGGKGTPDTTGVNMNWTGRYDPATGSGAVGQRRRWGQ